MIEFENLCSDKPFQLIKKKFDEAKKAGQKDIEAISISSYSKTDGEVNARFVNLKKIIDTEFIFFTNYNSQKANDFMGHDQITALIFWNSINLQIRIKAKVQKTSIAFNNQYFAARSAKKNALAISSDQSKIIDSYKSIEDKYNKNLKNNNLQKCPDYWGGFAFTPTYIEFWEGHKHRINKRDVYKLEDKNWNNFILQP